MVHTSFGGGVELAAVCSRNLDSRFSSRLLGANAIREECFCHVVSFEVTLSCEPRVSV